MKKLITPLLLIALLTLSIHQHKQKNKIFNTKETLGEALYSEGFAAPYIKSNVNTVESGEYCLYLQMGENFSAIRFSNSQNSNGVDIWDESLKNNGTEVCTISF